MNWGFRGKEKKEEPIKYIEFYNQFENNESTPLKRKIVFKLKKAAGHLLAFIPIIVFFVIAALIYSNRNLCSEGYEYINKQNYNKALECFNKAIINHEEENRALLGKGKALYNLKKYNEAIDIYKKLLDKGYNKKECHFAIGCSYYNLEKFNEALMHLEEAEKIGDKEFDVLEWKAYCFIRLGEYDKASQLCNNLIKEGDNTYLVHNAIGLVFLGKNDYKEAIGEFETSITMNSSYEDAYLNKIETLYSSNDIKKCMDFCNKAEKLFPYNDEIYLYRADCFSTEGEYEKAIKEYGRGLKINPKNIEIYSAIALQYFYLQQYDKATDYINQGMKINPSDEYVLKLKGWVEKESRPDSEKIIEFVKQNYLYLDKVSDFQEKCKQFSMKVNPTFRDVEQFINSIKVKEDRFSFVIANDEYDYIQEEDKASQIYTEELGKNIQLVKVCSFTSRVGEEFKTIIDGISQPDKKTLVIDLRDNGGGSSVSANFMLDMLLSKCTTVSFTTKNGEEKKYSSDERYTKFKKIIIWVNERSASSSEVMALSLKKHLNNVTIVGCPTVGKGVGQLTYENRKEKYMIFLVDFYWSVEGENILGKRITPDILINNSEETSYRNTTINLANSN